MTVTLDLPESVEPNDEKEPYVVSQGSAETSEATAVDEFEELLGSDWSEVDADIIAEKKFKDAIADAESALVEANIEEERLKGELKAARSHRTECLEELQRIKIRGIDAFKPAQKQASDADGEGGEDENDWRSVPTKVVIENISGMGAAKLESIIEQFPTLGDLEDARGRASQAHQSFAKVLPKGVGENLASAIENEMIETIARLATVVEAPPDDA